MELPKSATVREVGLRDGLQAEETIVPVEGKLRLYRALVAAGVERIEVTSFVAPRAIPQTADAEALLAAIGAHPGVSLSALVPNVRGLERALASGVDEVSVFLSASESHNRSNVNRTVEESLAGAADIARLAKEGAVLASAVIATSFSCPFEGRQEPARVAGIARRLHDLGFAPILFGDTIGAASPTDVLRLLDAVSPHIGTGEIGLHFHNTRGLAPANILAGLERGVSLFDASVGGLGGCPYAPGATGNVATEDVAGLFEGMGIFTGLDLSSLVTAGRLAASLVGHSPESFADRAFDTEKGVWAAYAH